MNDRAVSRIMSKMTTTIPERPKPPPKEQKTWQKLELGRKLKVTHPFPITFLDKTYKIINVGSIFTVIKVDSNGVILAEDLGEGRYFRIESKKWPDFLKKVPKSRKKKEAK
jgi:hypothetical protein